MITQGRQRAFGYKESCTSWLSVKKRKKKIELLSYTFLSVPSINQIHQFGWDCVKYYTLWLYLNTFTFAICKIWLFFPRDSISSKNISLGNHYYLLYQKNFPWFFSFFSSFYTCADGKHEWSLKHRDYVKTLFFEISRCCFMASESHRRSQYLKLIWWKATLLFLWWFNLN